MLFAFELVITLYCSGDGEDYSGTPGLYSFSYYAVNYLFVKVLQSSCYLP